MVIGASKNSKMVIRKKVLIVAYVGKNMERLLMVQDAKTGEWGSPGGGQKKTERATLNPRELEFVRKHKIDPNAYVAAERELAEETSGLFSKFKSQPETFTFTTLYRPPELLAIDRSRNEVVRSIYTVFLYEIPHFHVSLNNFVPNKEIRAIRIAPFHEFDNVWSFYADFYNHILTQFLIKKKNVFHVNKPHEQRYSQGVMQSRYVQTST
jgi:8-oxo-dGTP pyrophosphatase MutT (NUDIX family)